MKTVRRAMTLLQSFSVAHPEYGLSELAESSGIDKATARRMLVALIDHGLVEQDPLTRHYRLGVGVLRLAHTRESSMPLHLAARPLMQQLADVTTETVHLAIVDTGRLRMLDYIESSRANRVSMSGEDYLPLHATASGLCYLTFGPETALERCLAAPMQRYTASTLTDQLLLHKAVETTRDAGYAVFSEGFEEGVFGLAAPVYGIAGEFIAALGVATPLSRVDDKLIKRQVALVCQTAAALTTSITGRVSAGPDTGSRV